MKNLIFFFLFSFAAFISAQNIIGPSLSLSQTDTAGGFSQSALGDFQIQGAKSVNINGDEGVILQSFANDVNVIGKNISLTPSESLKLNSAKILLTGLPLIVATNWKDADINAGTLNVKKNELFLWQKCDGDIEIRLKL